MKVNKFNIFEFIQQIIVSAQFMKFAQGTCVLFAKQSFGE